MHILSDINNFLNSIPFYYNLLIGSMLAWVIIWIIRHLADLSYDQQKCVEYLGRNLTWKEYFAFGKRAKALGYKSLQSMLVIAKHSKRGDLKEVAQARLLAAEMKAMEMY